MHAWAAINPTAAAALFTDMNRDTGTPTVVQLASSMSTLPVKATAHRLLPTTHSPLSTAHSAAQVGCCRLHRKQASHFQVENGIARCC